MEKDDTEIVSGESTTSDISTISKMLEEPFDQSIIKTRPGNFGQTLAYVSGNEYIKKLNAALGGNWGFEIVEHNINETEVLVLGKLTCLNGLVVKMAFGGSSITLNKETGEIVSIVDDLKAASTDALKKAASLLGVGLHLYEENGQNTEKGNGKESQSKSTHSTSNGNGNGRLTAKQLAAIYAIGKSKGMEKDDIQRKSVQIFERMPDFLSKQQASDFIGQLQAG